LITKLNQIHEEIRQRFEPPSSDPNTDQIPGYTPSITNQTKKIPRRKKDICWERCVYQQNYKRKICKYGQ